MTASRERKVAVAAGMEAPVLPQHTEAAVSRHKSG